MTLSLLLLLWACGAVIALAVTAFALNEIHVLILFACIILPPSAIIASIAMILAEASGIIWRRK